MHQAVRDAEMLKALLDAAVGLQTTAERHALWRSVLIEAAWQGAIDAVVLLLNDSTFGMSAAPHAGSRGRESKADVTESDFAAAVADALARVLMSREGLIQRCCDAFGCENACAGPVEEDFMEARKVMAEALRCLALCAPGRTRPFS